jgi:hypothetical protein
MMAVPGHRYLVEGIVDAAHVSSPGLLRGRPQIWVSRIILWQHAVLFSPMSIVFGVGDG